MIAALLVACGGGLDALALGEAPSEPVALAPPCEVTRHATVAGASAVDVAVVGTRTWVATLHDVREAGPGGAIGAMPVVFASPERLAGLAVAGAAVYAVGDRGTLTDLAQPSRPLRPWRRPTSGAAWTGDRWVLTSGSDGRVAIADADGRLVAEIAVDGWPGEPVFDGARVVVPLRYGGLVAIDPRDGAVVRLDPGEVVQPTRVYPLAEGVAWQGGRHAGFETVVGYADGDGVHSVSTDGKVWLVLPDGRDAWVITGAGAARIDPRTGAARPGLGGAWPGAGPTGDFAPTHAGALAVDGGGDVVQVTRGPDALQMSTLYTADGIRDLFGDALGLWVGADQVHRVEGGRVVQRLDGDALSVGGGAAWLRQGAQVVRIDAGASARDRFTPPPAVQERSLWAVSADEVWLGEGGTPTVARARRGAAGWEVEAITSPVPMQWLGPVVAVGPWRAIHDGKQGIAYLHAPGSPKPTRHLRYRGPPDAAVAQGEHLVGAIPHLGLDLVDTRSGARTPIDVAGGLVDVVSHGSRVIGLTGHGEVAVWEDPLVDRTPARCAAPVGSSRIVVAEGTPWVAVGGEIYALGWPTRTP